MSPREWWRGGVLYQIYPRSFADANGDGIGDLPGIVEKLDYLAWLGVDGIWLNPIHPSPNVDWGYDVSDYEGVHPDLGTMEDLDRLLAEAGARGIRVLLDLVPNHTSDRHPWFRERPDWYVWADRVPNNWRAIFGGGSAWTFDREQGRYYLHNFAPGQPDLDWWNPEVRAEFERILRFWLDRGVAGFRIDVAHALVKDRELRDDPVAESGEVLRVRSMNRPEAHEILRSWRRIADAYDPPRVLLGEAYVLDVPAWAAFFGSGDDELHLAFNFALLHSSLDAEAMAQVVEATEAALPPGGWPCWVGSNHDAGRLATRWCGGDEALVRCALLVLATLRGTPCLYYGDELALENGRVPPARVRDVADPPRDPGRTPMPWTREGGWRDPWLPLEDTSRNVEDQRRDPSSTLSFTRDLLALRRARAELREGAYERVPAPDGLWAWRRGGRLLVAVNLGADAGALEEVEGNVVLATRRGLEGTRPRGALRLAPGEGAVVELAR
ncbi:MAG TPA: alpha-amylase family glycosyl hydrolase [Gaiellaceae bacterium]|nr:alpha-amylase family glycosyl hydrolase [Gaiellaceae bacterium]